MSDPAIIKQIGKNAKNLRIRKGIMQEELATQSGVGVATVANFENGRSINLSNMIKIMRTLDVLENIDGIFPEPKISPIQLKKLQGRQIRRVRKTDKED